MTDERPLMRALRGEALPVPPVWLMRQAGRYLPEYRAVRARAGSFLDLCYTPELAAEVTLQPIRRFGFDAAILFADILLVPHALGADLVFVEGEGPRLSTVTAAGGSRAAAPGRGGARDPGAGLRDGAPGAGRAAGRGAADRLRRGAVDGGDLHGRRPRHPGPGDRRARSLYRDPATFDALMERITEATIGYLLAQVAAGRRGGEALRLLGRVAARPALRALLPSRPPARIAAALRAAHPDVPVIGFPRGAGAGYARFAAEAGVQAVGARHRGRPGLGGGARCSGRRLRAGQPRPAAPRRSAAPALEAAARATVAAFAGRPHVFNLGHGITPDADPAHVEALLRAIRG